MAYSPQIIAETLAVLKANKGNLAKTSRETGVPYSTLRDWKKAHESGAVSVNAERQEAIVGQVKEKEEALGDVFEGFIRKVFTIGLTDAKLKEATIYNLMMAAAIATDKMQLLRGEPTAIGEQRGGMTLLQQFNMGGPANGALTNGKNGHER